MRERCIKVAFRIPGLNNFGIEKFEESIVAPRRCNLPRINRYHV